MGWSMLLLEFAALFWSCHLLLVSLATSEKLLEKVSNVQCRAEEMRFLLPSDFRDSAYAFGVLGNDGTIHGLQNDSACGFWVLQKLDGSTEVSAAYTGCYMRVEDEDYVMTLMIQYIVNGEVEHRKRDVKCPTVQAMDAPSVAECADVQVNDRIPCGNYSLSKEACEQLECCFSPRDFSLPCYFGKPVSAYCTRDQKFVVAISKDVTSPSLILDLIHVVGIDLTICKGLHVSQTSAFVRFDVPFSCGSHMVSENDIIYEINLEAKMKKNLITRDSIMRLTVRCSYSNTGVVPMRVEVFTPAPPLPVATTGPLFFELRVAKDDQYKSYYQDSEYPVIRTLRDPVHLEVRIVKKTDPNLVLVLNNCWATPSVDPTWPINWPILVDSCPYKEDRSYLTRLYPVGAPSRDVPYPSHYQRFIVSTFVFVDQGTYTALAGLVYFHCSASVCTQSATESCSRPCPSLGFSSSGQRKRRTAKEPLEVMVTKGPVFFKSIVKEADLPIPNAKDSSASEMLNETGDPSFIGIKQPIDDLSDGEKGLPRRIEDNHDPHSNMMKWLRGAAVGGSILALIVTVFGICRCRSRQTMHTVRT